MSSYFRFALFLILFSLSSCAEKVVKEKSNFFIEYYVRYLEPENQIRAEATFLEEKSQQRKKVAIEKAFFQEQKMEPQDLRQYGPRYRYETKGTFPEMLNFKFLNGQTYTHQSSMTPISSFSINSPLSSTNTITFNWEETPLLADESIVLLFSDKNQEVVSITHPGPTTTSSIEIPFDRLKKLTSGNGQLYLVKKRLHQTTSDHHNIQTLIEFYTKSIPIEIGNKN